jgi:LemA protein
LTLGGLLIPGIVFVFIILISIWFAYLFNRLYKYKNAAEANLGQIQVAMKKRLDMIEQLLGAVKGYVKYERDVFETVTKMRSSVMEAGPSNLEEIDRESRSLFGTIRAVAENYPDLKANETVNKLMDAVVSVEDEIARHRYTYNNIVQEYNTMQDTIPSNIVADIANLEKLNYLEFEEEVERAPVVEGIAPDE